MTTARAFCLRNKIGDLRCIPRFEPFFCYPIRDFFQQISGDLGSSAFFTIKNGDGNTQDRKSTRLNSSHVRISYAVFCLKKKTITYDNLYGNNKKKIQPTETPN